MTAEGRQMMKPFYMHDIEWDAAKVRSHREELIKIRDDALGENNFKDAVFFSITIGLLHHLMKELTPDKSPKQ
jgi:hypothetical protein